MQLSKIDVLKQQSSNQGRFQQSQVRNVGTFLHSESVIHSTLFNNQETKYDIQSLKQFYKSLKQSKDGQDRNVTQKTQITNVINNVFGLLREVLRANSQNQSFQNLFSLYIDLLKSKENSQHYFSLVEQHLKQLIQIDFQKYRKNKKIFYFIARIFPYCPHTVYKILQSRNQLFENDTKEAIQVYRYYINFAATKKNYSLLHEYIRVQLNSDTPSIQKLTILLTYLKQKLTTKVILQIELKLEKIIQSAKKYWRQSSSQKKLINLIEVFLKTDWPNQAKKYNSILKYVQVWDKQETIQKQAAINKFIKNLPSLAAQTAIFQQIKSKISYYIIQKINLVDRKKQKAFNKDLNLTFLFVNTLFQKLGKNNTQKLIQKEYLQKWVRTLLQESYSLKEGLVTVLSTIKKLAIHDLGLTIQRLLIEKIKIMLSQEKGMIMVRPYSQIYRGQKIRMEENLQSKPKTVQDMMFCIKAFRYFNFNNDSFTILYSMIKRYVLKKQIMNVCGFQFKKQIVKACLYIISKVKGDMESKNILVDVLGLIRQDNHLKQLFIKWSSQTQDFYSKKLYQIFNTKEHLQILFHDYSSKQITLKSFSIKILCILYPYNPCEIVPFLKRSYYQIYDRLSVQDMVKWQQKKIGLKLIRQIIRHRTEIITDDADQFCKFLYKQLNKNISGFHPQKNALTIEILKTLNSIMRRLPKHIFPYVKTIANFIIQLINSKYTINEIKKIAIQSFNQIIVNCGYVILPYFHFKNLLLIFREILKSDDNNQIYKNQLLKLIGGLGYVSRQKYFRLNKLTESTQVVKQVQSYFQKTFKEINYLKQVKNAIQIEEMKTFSSNSSYYNKQKSVKTYIQNFNYREYIISKTLKHINQNSTNLVFFNTFKTLQSFIYILPKNQQKIYQKLVFGKLLGKQIFPIQNTMSLFTKIVNKQEYVDYSNDLFNYFFKYLDDKQYRKKCLECLFRITIKYSRDLILNTKQFVLKIRRIALELHKQNRQKFIDEVIFQIRLCFGIINNLASHLDSYLHLFLPDFNNIFLARPEKVCQTYLCLLFNLFKNSGSIQYVLSQISEHLYNLLKSEIQMNICQIRYGFIHKIINFFICVMLFYGDITKGFIQNFHILLKVSNIKNPFYNIAEDFLKKNSSLDNMHYCFTKNQLNQLFKFQHMNIDIVDHIDTYKHESGLNAVVIHETIEQFNCDDNQIEQESEEWFNTLSILLFERSEQPFIRACSALVKQDKILCNDLFQFAFYFFWNILSNDLRKKLTMKLKLILQKKTISLRVKQKFIDALYFMEQCQFPIQLTDNILREAASQVLDLAKSLFYMEKLFLQDRQLHVQTLISMYFQMGEIQSALGLMQSFPNLYIKTKVAFLLKFNQHEKALEQLQTIKTQNLQYYELLIQVYKQKCEWDIVIKKCEANAKFKNKLSHLAVEAAINLQKWDQVKKYLPNVDPNHQNINLWKAMLNIYEKKYEEASKYIKKDREIIYPKICQLFNFSFERNMKGVIRLQRLTQLQEANEFLKIQNTEALNIQQRKRHKISISNKRRQIQTLWNDRMQGANNNLWATGQILLQRNLLFSKSQDIDNWMNYGKLALKEGQYLLCEKTLQSLKKEVDDPKKRIIIQLLLVECSFLKGELTEEPAAQKIQKIIQQKGSLNISLHQYYYKSALWLSQKQTDFTIQRALKSVQMLNLSVKSFKTYIKGWHLLGLMHYKIVELFQKKKPKVDRRVSNILSSSRQIQDLDSSFRNNKQPLKQLKQQRDSRQYHILESLHSYIRSVSCGLRNHQYFLQDCLKIMNIIFIQQEVDNILDQLQNCYTQIPSQGLIQIIPQIVGRLDIVQKPGLLEIMKKLLIHIGFNHPQAIVFPLIYLKNGNSKTKKNIAESILKQINKKEGSQLSLIYLDADKIAQQLCKVSLKLNEKFIIFVAKISARSNLKGVCSVSIAEAYIKFIQDLLSQNLGRLSVSEFGFMIQYRQDFKQIANKLKMYIETSQTQLFKKAQIIIRSILSQNKKNLQQIKKIYLQEVSPSLHNIKSSKMGMFGTYNPNNQQIYIQSFKNQVVVINSKQRPKKIVALGSDGKQYNYLLKGKQDLRLDQRIMQLISLINKMFHEPSQRQNYSIMGYSITPVSLETGIISWVQNCDTIGQIIHKERSSSQIFLQRQISRQICQFYHILPNAQKVQIYKEIQQRVSGTDLKNVFWIRSSSSEDWLKSRTTYIRSLAVMSIVGYIIGLGDRHPNNIMIQKDTGQIVHIDFGDCFDVNKMRKEFPQKVPFRLTRMLVKAMQPCGVIGIFKHTCQKIINLLRSNKQSIIAIVQAFKYDPLIGWRLVKDGDQQNKMLEHSFQDNDQSFLTKVGQKQKKNDRKQGKNIDFAQHILNEIKNKLNGVNPKNATKVLKSMEQVQMLIGQAMSPQNLVQHYEGWSIYW